MHIAPHAQQPENLLHLCNNQYNNWNRNAAVARNDGHLRAVA